MAALNVKGFQLVHSMAPKNTCTCNPNNDWSLPFAVKDGIGRSILCHLIHVLRLPLILTGRSSLQLHSPGLGNHFHSDYPLFPSTISQLREVRTSIP